MNIKGTVKYYATNVYFLNKHFNKMKELGYKGRHNQFRVVCKAKSMAEANRIAKSYGLGEKCFSRDYTAETGNGKEIELCEQHQFIVCVDGSLGLNYVGIEIILNNNTPQILPPL